MNKKMIIDAYCKIRTIDQTISDDVLDFMKDCALKQLEQYSEVTMKTAEEIKNKVAIEHGYESFNDFVRKCDFRLKIKVARAVESMMDKVLEEYASQLKPVEPTNENIIIESTKEFAKENNIYFDDKTESMILNAIRSVKLTAIPEGHCIIECDFVKEQNQKSCATCGLVVKTVEPEKKNRDVPKTIKTCWAHSSGTNLERCNCMAYSECPFHE